MSDSKKHFEIERKYRLTEDEYKNLPAKLSDASFTTGRKVIERDTFFPVEKKGDMSRIREEDFDGAITYTFTRKTWVETAGNQERSEREEEISAFIRECLFDAVQRLSPIPLRKLSKQRAFFELEQSAGAKVVVVLDYVRDVGHHSGPYMEIELIIEDEKDVPSAREKIQEFASMLLHDDRDYIRMSYQDMVNETAQARAKRT